MKNYILPLSLFLASCGSNDNKTVSTELETVVEMPAYDSNSYDTIPYVYTESNIISSANKSITNTQSSSSGDYNNGKSFGYNMGYIAGQESAEYNPYLPVGPNVRTYSIEFRQGYAAGYSEGYEKGQQTTHQGIYSDDNYSDDGGGVYYYYEDDDY